jgi:hypothetical protein
MKRVMFVDVDIMLCWSNELEAMARGYIKLIFICCYVYVYRFACNDITLQHGTLPLVKVFSSKWLCFTVGYPLIWNMFDNQIEMDILFRVTCKYLMNVNSFHILTYCN